MTHQDVYLWANSSDFDILKINTLEVNNALHVYYKRVFVVGRGGGYGCNTGLKVLITSKSKNNL